MFRRIAFTKTPFTLQKRALLPTYQLYFNPKLRFSENSNKNFDELMSSKSKISPVSIGVGLLAAASLIAYLNFTKDPVDKTNQSPSNPNNNPNHLNVSQEDKKIIDPTGQNSIDTATRLQQQAKEQFSLGEYDEVFDLVDLALQVLHDIGKQGTIEEGNIYFDLGFYRFHSNQLPEAREAFTQAYNIYDKIGQNDKGFDTLDMMALTYEQDAAEGEAFYEKSIKKRKEKLSRNDPELASAYIQYGMWHLRHLRNAKGLECFDQAYSVLKENIPKEQEERIGLVYKQLMNAYKEAKAFPQALEAANKCVKYLDTHRQPLLLEDIAILYSQANNLNKSVEFYEKHLDLLKQLGKGNGEIGKGIRETATEFEKKKDDEKAINYWRQFSGLFDKEDKSDVAALSLYGNLRAFALYNRRDRIKEAKKELEDVVSKSSKLLGNDHMYTLSLKRILETYSQGQEGNQPKLDVQSLSLILIALEDNLQKLIDTGFINL